MKKGVCNTQQCDTQKLLKRFVKSSFLFVSIAIAIESALIIGLLIKSAASNDLASISYAPATEEELPVSDAEEDVEYDDLVMAEDGEEKDVLDETNDNEGESVEETNWENDSSDQYNDSPCLETHYGDTIFFEELTNSESLGFDDGEVINDITKHDDDLLESMTTDENSLFTSICFCGDNMLFLIPKGFIDVGEDFENKLDQFLLETENGETLFSGYIFSVIPTSDDNGWIVKPITFATSCRYSDELIMEAEKVSGMKVTLHKEDDE